MVMLRGRILVMDFSFTCPTARSSLRSALQTASVFISKDGAAELQGIERFGLGAGYDVVRLAICCNDVVWEKMYYYRKKTRDTMG